MLQMHQYNIRRFDRRNRHRPQLGKADNKKSDLKSCLVDWFSLRIHITCPLLSLLALLYKTHENMTMTLENQMD